jgi:MFS family permease
MKTNRYLIALVVALGLFPLLLDTTIVTVALTPIRTDLRTDVNTVQWILTGYLLANAAVITAGGYLANRFGRKRMFLLGLLVFTLGSVLAGARLWSHRRRLAHRYLPLALHLLRQSAGQPPGGGGSLHLAAARPGRRG